MPESHQASWDIDLRRFHRLKAAFSLGSLACSAVKNNLLVTAGKLFSAIQKLKAGLSKSMA